jgi:heptaprenyl diphosphate synthase
MMHPSISARTAARLGILVSIAVTLQIAESMIPRPLPWLRLGLANAVTLLVLVRMGFRSALAVALLRVVLCALLLGTFGGPAFLLSASGALLATLAMAFALRAAPPLSLLGVSVAGSAAHVIGQLAAISPLLRLGSSVAVLAPILLATAVPLGLVTGAFVLAVHRRVAPW